jgi:tripartite-type tricarboxylate transporter receptor subunit TctC
MNPPRRRLLGLAASAAVLPLASRVRAQAWPARPITVIVPASAGGPTDAISRVLADRLGAALGQTVLIDNVGGASGTIGVGKLARAAPDGYTLCVGQWSHFVLNGATYTLQFDLLNDFQTVSLLTTGPMLVVTRKTLPANNFAELVAWLKANPDKASSRR